MEAKRGSSLVTFLLLVLVLGGFLVLVMANTTPAAPLNPGIPTQVVPTQVSNEWLGLLREDFGDSSTPLPTVAIPTQAARVPTLALVAANADAVSAADLGDPDAVSGLAAVAVTPTLPPATVSIDDASSSEQQVAEIVTVEAIDWNPPPLIPPISRDPLGRDHFILHRPMESNTRNRALFFYPYGSDGTSVTMSRIHHGIDFPNPVGTQVRAAGSGTVIFASDDRLAERRIFQNSASYGNAVFIEHDFGYQGQAVYTLYAHLAAVLVEDGQRVEAGDPIALSGDSGGTTGPHLHLEVRVGGDRYGDTYNPLLWVVPYVGHGVIAGRITDDGGNWLQDVQITIRNWATGRVHETTTSYMFLGTVNDVNPDPNWQENFAVGDVPVGRYDVIAEINGERVIRQVEVFEGMTSFVELRPLTDTDPG